MRLRETLFADDEFFAARLSNPHTRCRHACVVERFLAWFEVEDLGVSPVSRGLAGRSLDELAGDSSSPRVGSMEELGSDPAERQPAQSWQIETNTHYKITQVALMLAINTLYFCYSTPM